MNEQTIHLMQINDLLRSENIYSIQAEPEEIREQLKALYFARLNELNADKDLKNQVKRMFKAFEKADKELADAYTRQHAKENAEIRVLEEPKKKLFGSTKARVEIIVKDAESKACCCDCGCEKESAENVECVETKDVCTDACDCGCECEANSEECCDGNCDEDCCAPLSGGEMTDGERTVEFLEGLFDLLHITACTELVSEGEKVEINVTAANTNSIIGKHGVMIDAIQTLAGAVANTGRDEYKRVVVDCENYRENREATLNKLSENLAQKAIRLGKKIKLEPMNPYERRIIHAALSEREGVSTQSEGKEPNRYIVIIPDNLEDPDAPALSARNDRDRRDNRNGYRGNNRGGYGNRNGCSHR